MNDPLYRLRIWKEANELAISIYRSTRSFPVDEKYGLTSQMRRAANSVAATIAEGWSRRSRKEYINFLSMARGSASEMVQHCLIAGDLGYLDHQTTKILVFRYRGLAAGIHACLRALEKKK